MSRTIPQIYNSIISEKENHTQLDLLQPNPDTAQTFFDDLTTTSKVAMWRLMVYLFSFAIWVVEGLFDVFEATVEARALELIPGTVRWYVVETLAYQHGDDLVWDGEKYEYASTSTSADEAKRIITQSSAQDVSGAIIIKIARGDVGSLAALTAAQLAGYEAYLDQIKFAGTATTVITDTADLLKIAYNVYYDATVLAADGSLLSDATSFPVVTAVDAYIQGLPFGGIMTVAGLTDAIQAATGVNNVVATTVEAKYGAVPYSDILALANQSYTPNAGYLGIDPAFPLVSQITYTAS